MATYANYPRDIQEERSGPLEKILGAFAERYGENYRQRRESDALSQIMDRYSQDGQDISRAFQDIDRDTRISPKRRLEVKKNLKDAYQLNETRMRHLNQMRAEERKEQRHQEKMKAGEEKARRQLAQNIENSYKQALEETKKLRPSQRDEAVKELQKLREIDRKKLMNGEDVQYPLHYYSPKKRADEIKKAEKEQLMQEYEQPIQEGINEEEEVPQRENLATPILNAIENTPLKIQGQKNLKNYIAPTPEKPVSEMSMQEYMDYAKAIDKELDYHTRRKGLKGVASGVTAGLSELIPGFQEEPGGLMENLAFTAGEFTGSLLPIAAVESAVGRPLIKMATKSPAVQEGVKAIARATYLDAERMAAMGLTGSLYESLKSTIKGKVPSLEDAAKWGAEWALIDGAFQFVGKGLGYVLEKLSAGAEKASIPVEEATSEFLSEVKKIKTDPAINPEKYVKDVEGVINDVVKPLQKTEKGALEKAGMVINDQGNGFEYKGQEIRFNNSERNLYEKMQNSEGAAADHYEKQLVKSLRKKKSKIDAGQYKLQSPELAVEKKKAEVTPTETAPSETTSETKSETASFAIKPPELSVTKAKEQKPPKPPEPIVETTGKGPSQKINYVKSSGEKMVDYVINAVEAAKSPVQSAKAVSHSINSAVFNFLAPLEKLESEAGVSGTESVANRLRYAMSANAEINSIIDNGIMHPKTGEFISESYAKIYGENIKSIKPDGKSLSAYELNDYRTARRALDRQKKGIKTGIDTAEARKTVNELDSKYRDVAEKVRQEQAKAVEVFGKDTLGEKGIQNFNKDYYSPMYRYMDSGSNSMLQSGSLKPSKPWKTQKGSTRDILNPMEGDITNLNMLVSNKRKNDAVLQLKKLIAEEKLPGSIKKAKLEKAPPIEGIEIDPGTEKLHTNIYNQTRKNGFAPEKNVLRGWENGKAFELHVPDEIYEAFESVQRGDRNIIGDVLAASKNVLSFGIAKDPRKFVSILSRDALSTMIYSKHGIGVPSIVDALGKIYKNDNVYKQFLAMGGDVYSARLASRWEKTTRMNDLVTKGHEGIMVPFNQMGRFFRKISQGMDNISMAIPLAEYNAALKKYGNTEMGRFLAAMDARAATYDPTIKGGSKIVKGAASYLPFFNVSMQDYQRLATNITRPEVFAKGVAAITLPSLYLKWLNEQNPDYQALTPLDKAAFYHIYMGDYHYRIPTTWLLGTVFKVGGETMFDMMQAMRGQKDWDGMFKGLFESFTDNVTGSLPPIVSTLVELETGKSFSSPLGWLLGKESRSPEVVPRRLQNLPPKLQYTNKTSQLARWFGDMWNASPVKIERVIRNQGGSIAQSILEGVDEILYNTGMVKDQRPQDIENFALRLTKLAASKTPKYTKYQQDFYTYLDEYQKQKAASKIDMSYGDNAILDVDMTKANSEVSKLYKEMREIEDSDLSNQKKAKEIEQIQKEINALYKYYTEEVKEAKKK